ncbi:DNA-directed RNA polymerase subunit beta [Nocardia beijingensis]|uniref:DNA-directed RNA polymerase subunit beta n=1 Tax=Nocardia beijingensis TaxID=95162 RepID=UPI001893444E|nr:DNA-directed RNA polymerase subunit beta [Nocardia beijingensis]MBF6464879.1 DNA-directed RNA polymerase subunit beta [Nocardia beijingensis]
MDEGAFEDTPLSRCMFYRRNCGLNAVIDPPELGRIVMRAGSVWAVTMPSRLGRAVKAHMQGRGVAPGPIVGHPRSDRWTFLIRPDIEDDDVKLFAEMFRRDVSIAREGAVIALPSPGPNGCIRQWVVPARNAFLPSGLAVIDAVRAWSAVAR